MSVMLANRPSPRPGFTYVAREKARREGPVVVVVSGSPGSLAALERAASEASLHSVQLHVLELGSPGDFETGVSQSPEDDRVQEAGRSILHNPHVTLIHVDLTDQDVAAYCRGVAASMLVVDVGYYERAAQPGESLGSVHQRDEVDFDLLIVHPPLHH